MNLSVLERHRKSLEGACKAIREGTYWSACPGFATGKTLAKATKDAGVKERASVYLEILTRVSKLEI